MHKFSDQEVESQSDQDAGEGMLLDGIGGIMGTGLRPPGPDGLPPGSIASATLAT